ncbi:MAG TPA: beta-galactosidase [Bacteroidota bacterium]|nr:beta-galactosidase [Bacteroidota bacterium]
MTVGIYYYPEHWDPGQWERDIRKIASTGFEFVHLAEFAWTQMEPEEGKYDFTWLDTVVGLCAKNHLKVLLCTPSATTPAWMRDRYPETFVMEGHYIRSEHGTRGLGSIVNPLYRTFVGKIVTEMAKRYGNNPAVVGWQLDNEPDAKPDYSPASQEAFRQWLRKKYVTIDAMNTDWGTAFWSQRYARFDEIIIPNTTIVGWWGNNPHALLDFKRYSADAQAEFLDFQAATLRKHISSSQYITTNYTAVCQGADPRRTTLLDFATFTAYPNGGQPNIGSLGFRLGDNRPMTFANDYYRTITGVTGVMELQPGAVNWGDPNPLLLPGTVRMWLWYNFGAGSSLASSYRFRQILYGAEQYHSGIVKTDGVSLSPGGEEYAQFIGELKNLRKQYTSDATMPKRISMRRSAVLWNLENFWSLNRQKQTSQWDAWGYPGKYQEILKSFGAPVDIIGENADLSPYTVVVIPAYELVDSIAVKHWRDYAANGGHLVLTCRTATKDRRGHFWEAECAAPISGLIGAHITATDMLPAHVQGELSYKSEQYTWNNWGDLLKPESGTNVLASYTNQFYAGTAAVVQRSLGKGTVTYIGVDTDSGKLEKDMMREIFTHANVPTENYPEGVFVNWRSGFFVAVNFSSTEYTIDLPAGATILIGGKHLAPAGVTVWTGQ